MNTPVQKEACSKCRGIGFTKKNVPFGHPDFGKAFPCDCTLAERKAKQQERAGIMDMQEYRTASFDTFDQDQPGVSAAYDAALEFSLTGTGFLILIGPPGCGKTHLAATIAHARIAEGDTVMIETVPDLLDHLRAAFHPAATETFDERFKRMKKVDLVVLDDLGAQNDSPWATEKLYQLINYRYNMGMSIVVTSNRHELSGVDDRIRSRLRDTARGNVIEMVGAQDYRLNPEKPNPQRRQDDEI